jgi:tetratricopeptide (TPR) repeat protein
LVKGYIRAVIPRQSGTEVDMYTKGLGNEATPQEAKEAAEIAAATTLNMSICFFLLGDYVKASEKATESLGYVKTYKAYYRRAKACQKRGDLDRAVADMTEAIKLDPSDPHDIGQELAQLKVALREQTRKAQAKMAGFLLQPP